MSKIEQATQGENTQFLPNGTFITKHVNGSYTIGIPFDSKGEGGGCATFTFSEIERLRKTEENVYLKIDIRTDVGAKKKDPEDHVFSARVNLASMSAREGIIRAVNRMTKTKTDFDTIFSRAIEILNSQLDQIQAGEWIEECSDESVAPLFTPFIAKDSATVLFGKGGSGKTFIALRIALSISTGKPFIGYKPSEKCKILFVDYENNGGVTKDRIYKLCGDPSFNPSLEDIHGSIKYLSSGGVPLQDLSNTIKAIISENGIGLVIIDSVALACGGEPEKADTAMRYFNTIASWKVATLSIAHETKSENHAYPFGSVFFWNCPRSIWNVQAEQGADENSIEVALIHRKSNDAKLRTTPIPLKIKFEESAVSMVSGDIDTWESELSTSERIIKFLKTGGRQRYEIEEELSDRTKNAVRCSLKKLRNSGKIILVGGQNGMYALPVEKGQTP